ncbi:glycosyltransferase [Clostridium sp. DL1XJH146]
MKIALVHDWLPYMGGAERVLINFKEIYPEAPLYTSIYNSDRLDEKLKNIDVRTSFLQKKKKAITHHQKYFPFMPMAFESFNLNEYELILSSSTCCAKGVITNPNTMHICYCNSPMRYGWEFYYEYASREKMNPFKKIFLKYFMNYMRIWDNVSSDRVDFFIANSENVAKRIWKHYRRESVVIHPPVNINFFKTSETVEDYFLIVSRLVSYKRIDIAVEAFNELGLPLIIIGDGPEKKKLEMLSKDNIKFLGRKSDKVIRDYYCKCQAFIFPGEEDFGITPLEAQASGRPVIAYGKGGVLETVINNRTGVFFYEQTPVSLIAAIGSFKNLNFVSSDIRKHVEKFSEENFRKKIEGYIENCLDNFTNKKKWKVI